MPRRDLTQWLAGALAIVLLGAGAWIHVPYVSLAPGPAINTLGRTQGGAEVLGITGARTYPTNGELDLTTVDVRDHITLFAALKGWLSSREAVIPREFVFPENQSTAQNQAQNVQEMSQSQHAAADAALSQLGLARVAVDSVIKGGPSVGKLQPGDVIESVDGTRITGAGPLRALIRRHRIGEDVVLGIQRAGALRSVTIRTGPSTEDKTKAAVGIISKIVSDIKVNIELNDIGGPSAGLMFALGIIDKLGPDSLTGGRIVAGTGTIASDGTVGPIGGIAEKLLGARGVGATLFLVPADNCAEAADHRPAGLTLARVTSLQDALKALSVARAGGTPTPC